MKSWAKSVFKAGVLAAGLFGFAFVANAADDSCDPVPDCESLGYVKNLECKQNTSVSCPYDATYKRCINADCEALGYTLTDKKSWCKEIIPCPTDSTYTLCKKKCADCTAPSTRSPYCPFGRVAVGTDECGNKCYTCAECTYDLDRGYDNPEYASLSCPIGTYIETVIKPLCPTNTAVKYVCRPCPTGTTSLALNSTSCVCDTTNGFYRACPTGAYCDIYKTKIFGTCYKPKIMNGDDDDDCGEPCDPEDPNCVEIPCEQDPCKDDPGDCYCDGRKGYVSWNQADPHYTYSAEKFSFILDDHTVDCKKVTGCSGYEGSTADPVFDSSHFDTTYFSVIKDPETGDYGFTRGSQTCYWVTGCSGDPYVEKIGSTDCCTGRIYTDSKTYGDHTCGLCPCDGRKNIAYYPTVPTGRVNTYNECSYQGCYHATACDVNGQHYSSSWSDKHFNYGNYVEFPECKEVLSCNVYEQNAQKDDFNAIEKSFFTTASTTNGARTCYYITGCNAANNPMREDNCDAVELTWASGSPQYMIKDSSSQYRCGTCVCDEANGYYLTCPTGAVCETVGRCKHTIKGGDPDPDKDGCNNADGYVPTSDPRDSHFTYGSEVTFNIGNKAQTCVKVTGCNSSVDGSTLNAPSNSGNYIKPDYHTSTSKKIAATTCYWVTGCTDSRVYTSGSSYGSCIRTRGYKDSSCRDYGGKHCCICTTLTCTEQFPASSYIVYTTSQNLNNRVCTDNGTQEADQKCYTCICDADHCNGTNCGTQTHPCPRSTYPYTYCAHAVQGTPCNTITRDPADTGLCHTVEKGDYVTYYEKKQCIDNGTNECYMDVPNGCCREKACADYSDYKIEASERDTTHYVYEEITRCSGTGTRKCYRYKGCNTGFYHYDTEQQCLNADSCTLTCGTNSYGCQAQTSTKGCSYDTGHTSSDCDTTCFNCSDTHSFCGGRTCYNPIPLYCRGTYNVSSGNRISEHDYSSGTVKAGNSSTGACYDLTCYHDNGCDTAHGYFGSNSACIGTYTGFSKCGYNSSTGCYSPYTSGAVAKTCEKDYSLSSSCDSSSYDCSDTYSKPIGFNNETCYNPIPLGCPYPKDECDNSYLDCYNESARDNNYQSGTQTICCANYTAKSCSELGYLASESDCPSGYKCKKTYPCSKTCWTTDGCDSSHCGTGCSTNKKECPTSTYPYTDSDIPTGASGSGVCYPACPSGATRYKDWSCNSGKCYNGTTCDSTNSCTSANKPSESGGCTASCKSPCTPVSRASNGNCSESSEVCEEWQCSANCKLEGGECKPATCDYSGCSEITSKPEHSSYTSPCTITYTDCTTKSVYENWACDSGYCPRGNECKKCTPVTKTAITSKPEGAEWIDEIAINACCDETSVHTGWQCSSGWHPKGTGCEKNCTNTCSGLDTLPAHATSAHTCKVIDTNCNEGAEKIVLWDCNDGYYKSGNSCVKKSCAWYGLEESCPTGYTATLSEVPVGDTQSYKCYSCTKQCLSSCPSGYSTNCRAGHCVVDKVILCNGDYCWKQESMGTALDCEQCFIVDDED